MGRREGPVETRLRTRAAELGGLCWKLAPTRSGIPDRVLVFGGRVVFVETKAPGETARRLQRVRHAALRARGIPVRIVDSDGDADALVEELSNLPPREADPHFPLS